MLFPPKNSPPFPPPRVVVTGTGIVSALGTGWRVNAEGLRAGRPAIRPVTLFDVSRHRAKTAAEADLPPCLPHLLLKPPQVRRLNRATQMLLFAAHEAWEQSGWEPSAGLPMVLGTTAGGMSQGETYYRVAVQTPRQHRQQTTRAVQYQAQTQGRMVAEALGFNGPITVISNACASSANAIGHAWELIGLGLCERALAGGYDALSQLVFTGFDSLQALTTTVCRPFDAHRDGLAIGEGAAMLALETLEAARRRQASIVGEIIGYGATMDLFHLTQPHPQGDAAYAAMKLACERARVTPSDIDYVNAHGTGTALNDSAEARGIQQWAGNRSVTLPVSSTKATIGHLLGGAGAVEAVICLMTLREQWLPPEVAFETPDPSCNFPIVRKPQDARVNVVLSNSFGFGGGNATLIFRRWP